jgi:hypothetical protein
MWNGVASVPHWELRADVRISDIESGLPTPRQRCGVTVQ